MSPEERKAAYLAVNQAVSGLLDSEEISISWCLIIDVAGPNHRRYLAHRAGGGSDGTDAPMTWHALGMLRAGMKCAERQLEAHTYTEADLDGIEIEEDEDDSDG